MSAWVIATGVFLGNVMSYTVIEAAPLIKSYIINNVSELYDLIRATTGVIVVVGALVVFSAGLVALGFDC